MQQQYNIIETKSVQKKLILKKYSSQVVNKLTAYISSPQFHSDYPDTYISDNGIVKSDFELLVHRLKTCSDSTVYGHRETVNTDTGETEETTSPIESHSCHAYSLCPICASNKRAEVLSSIRPQLDVLKAIAARKKDVFLYTGCITIKDTCSPVDDYETLRKNWTDFSKMGQLRKNGKTSKGESAKIIGSLLSVEIVPKPKIEGQATFYHVHAHILLVTKDPLDYEVYDSEKKAELEKIYGKKRIPKELLDSIALNDQKLSKLTKEWFKVSGAKNFFVNPLVDRVFTNTKTGETVKKDVSQQLYEVVKYTTKPWELEGNDAFVLYEALQNKKRITKSGVFTKRKRFVDILENLALKYGLFETYQEKLKESESVAFDDLEEGQEILSAELFNVIYDSVKETATLAAVPWTMQAKLLPGYKDYLSDRMAFVNQYRRNLKRLKNIIPSVRSGIISAERWIRAKSSIRNKMCEKIEFHSMDLIKYVTPKKPKKYRYTLPFWNCEKMLLNFDTHINAL